MGKGGASRLLRKPPSDGLGGVCATDGDPDSAGRHGRPYRNIRMVVDRSRGENSYLLGQQSDQPDNQGDSTPVFRLGAPATLVFPAPQLSSVHPSKRSAGCRLAALMRWSATRLERVSFAVAPEFDGGLVVWLPPGRFARRAHTLSLGQRITGTGFHTGFARAFAPGMTTERMFTSNGRSRGGRRGESQKSSGARRAAARWQLDGSLRRQQEYFGGAPIKEEAEKHARSMAGKGGSKVYVPDRQGKVREHDRAMA